MDVPRKSAAKKRKIKRIIYAIIAIIAAAGITVAVSRLKPAAQSVSRSTVTFGTVKRGELLRQVRGNGTLVPEAIQLVPAQVQGRITRKLVQPGAQVSRDTVLFEMSNPQTEQELLDAKSQYTGAQANRASLKVQLERAELDQKGTLRTVESEYQKAKMAADQNKKLGDQGLRSDKEVQDSRITAEALAYRVQVEKERLGKSAEEVQARLRAEDERVKQLASAVQIKQQQVDYLKVRAGIDGVVQVINVQEGQQVNPGQDLARVADPSRLKAEIKIDQNQARDVGLGQSVVVDTRTGQNSTVEGTVSRIDNGVQNGTITIDVQLTSELPKGARPDLSVEGTVLLEKLQNVLYVERPVLAQENGNVGLFKVEEDGAHASRTKVELGRSSVRFIEVKNGLKEGDQIILSDTSQFDTSDRIRLN